LYRHVGRSGEFDKFRYEFVKQSIYVLSEVGMDDFNIASVGVEDFVIDLEGYIYEAMKMI
jgi:hypothetical protein